MKLSLRFLLLSLTASFNKIWPEDSNCIMSLSKSCVRYRLYSWILFLSPKHGNRDSFGIAIVLWTEPWACHTHVHWLSMFPTIHVHQCTTSFCQLLYSFFYSVNDIFIFHKLIVYRKWQLSAFIMQNTHFWCLVGILCCWDFLVLMFCPKVWEPREWFFPLSWWVLSLVWVNFVTLAGFSSLWDNKCPHSSSVVGTCLWPEARVKMPPSCFGRWVYIVAVCIP